MTRRWQHWRETVEAAMYERGWDQGDLAKHARISTRTVNGYLSVNARDPATVPKGVLRIEGALGWAPGSTRAVLEGGQPIAADQRVQPLTRDQKFEQIRLLCEGDLSDSQLGRTVRVIIALPDAPSTTYGGI